jgi:DNA repair exonuclease SbcCD ATPase subunit
MKLATEDLQARKAQDIRELRFILQDLLMQVTAAQATLAEEERSYRADTESAVTDLERIKADADMAFSRAQTEQLSRKERLQRDQNEEFRALTSELPRLLARTEELGFDAETPEYQKLKALERELRNTPVPPEDGPEPDIEGENPYPARISELEREKKDLMQAIRDDEHNARDRIIELTNALEESEADFKEEVAQMHADMKKQDETYRKQLERLYGQLETVQAKRAKAAAVNNSKIQAWEQKIDALDYGFKQRLNDAHKIVEGLKSSLTTANFRKAQHLEIEQKRAQDEQKFVQELLNLKQHVFNLQKQVEKAKEETVLLRRELSAKIGTRRTASLFL